MKPTESTNLYGNNIESYKNINEIIVVLGYGCNFRCRYCCEYENVLSIQNEIHPEFIDFLSGLIHQTNPEEFHITFFGGEPLLYEKHLRSIVDALKHEPNITFSISTNGSLLTKELVRYINDNNIFVGMSWDGRNTLNTRKRDIIQEKTIRDLFFEIKNKKIMCVFSSENYPLQFLEDMHQLRYTYWKQTKKETIEFTYEIIMDQGIPDVSLVNMDLDRLYNDLTIICNKYRAYLRGTPIENVTIEFVERLLGYVKYEYTTRTDFFYTAPRCFTMSNLMSLDINGKFHTCHIEDSTIGNIHQSFDEVLSHYDGLDFITKEAQGRCSQCEVVALCKCGCPLIRGEKRDWYCKTYQAFYKPLLVLFQELQQ